MTNRTDALLVVAALASTVAGPAHAGPVSSVAEMPGAIVLDIAQGDTSQPLGPFVFVGGPATITGTTAAVSIPLGTVQSPAMPGFFNRSSTCTAVPSWCGGTDDSVNPGDFKGRFGDHADLVITFDVPVGGVGLSFYSNGNGGTMSTGSTLTAYSGPDGTGAPLGSVTSPDTDAECCPFTSSPPWYFIFFRGVTADAGNIRSVVVSPTDPANGWGLDAIAVAPASGPGGCNAADLAPPSGVLDLADINAFVSGFVAQDPIADLEPDGLFDLADINVFVAAFVAGCP